MAITEEQLAIKIEEAYDAVSGDSNVNPEEARKQVAEDLAAAIAQFVIGRQTTGVSSDGATVNTTING